MEMPFRSIKRAALHCLHRRQCFFGKKLKPYRLGDDLRWTIGPSTHQPINSDDWRARGGRQVTILGEILLEAREVEKSRWGWR